MLPETSLASSEEHGTPSRHTEENGDHFSEIQEPSTLNAYAAEFLPTLTMSCPLVGICEVIAEGDETEECLQDGPSTQPLIVNFSPTPGLPSEGPKDHALKSSSKRYWKKARDPCLEVQRDGDVHREEITEECLRRRTRNIEVGKETMEYQYLVEQRRLGLTGAEPLTPDPEDRSLSKRRWDREVQNWRQELRKNYLLETTGISSRESVPEAASVVSTEAEEAQSSEADDTATVNSDETSSQHW